jgi:chemotaxis protein CheD
MGKMIKVGMADLQLCKSPDAITTLGLGSCVGIAVRDPVKKIGGLAHIMLPDSTKIQNNSSKPKFADTGIAELVNLMLKEGAVQSRIVAKIAGGAQMFSFQNKSELVSIGDRNVEASKLKLKEMGIRILAEDTGANYGRTVEFYPETGEFLIKAVGKAPKTI